ncbi:sterol carrier protein domain-containing protein [Microbacterium sp. NPDC090281]|uniref:sterol carrier protein domain-containing protein n=1 Tax=Microbacterium sp. NPDC090281 TaxID=3364208 RepID=UPI0038112DD1
MRKHEVHGMELFVEDFWCGSSQVERAMLAFLGAHSTRLRTVQFRRASMPPGGFPARYLHRFDAQAEAWHPWMLRLLSVKGALEARGWGEEVALVTHVGLLENGRTQNVYMIEISSGHAQVTPSPKEPDVCLSQGQLAVWYAGGYRSANSARSAGVYSRTEQALRAFVAATSASEPWIPDLF